MAKKHPPKVNPPADALLPNQMTIPHDIVFDSLDANLIQRAAIRTSGAAGLSGLDAFAWHRLCTSYKSASTNLCKAMAAVGRLLIRCQLKESIGWPLR